MPASGRGSRLQFCIFLINSIQQSRPLIQRLRSEATAERGQKVVVQCPNPNRNALDGKQSGRQRPQTDWTEDGHRRAYAPSEAAFRVWVNVRRLVHRGIRPSAWSDVVRYGPRAGCGSRHSSVAAKETGLAHRRSVNAQVSGLGVRRWRYLPLTRTRRKALTCRFAYGKPWT